MINLNPNSALTAESIKAAWEAISSTANNNKPAESTGEAEQGKSDFAKAVKAVETYISKVDEMQQSSDLSIKDLLSGKNEDITSVISAVAKADMSFKLLVGVRNKLIEAYKQTMTMQL